MRSRIVVLLALVASVGCSGKKSSSAPPPAPGSLDATFGTAGVSQIDLGATARLTRITIQSDQKIVAVGGIGKIGTNGDLLIARFNTDGSLDTTFAGTGWRAIDLGSTNDFATDVVALPNGKLVVAAIPGSCRAAVVRLDATGNLDPSFATGGVFNLAPGSGGISMCTFAEAVQPVDGKILLGGASLDFALARFTTTGSLDTGFGTGGLVTTDFGQNDQIFALALQGDGKIVAAGSSQGPTPPGTPTAIAAARYDPFAGALDATFGSAGRFTLTMSATNNMELVSTVLPSPNGKLLMLGTNGGTPNPYSLLRLTPAGARDATFGVGGRVDRDYGAAMTVDGANLYVVGTRYSGPVGTGALARLSVDGASDTTFGTSGEVTLLVGASTDLASLAVQANGKIVIAGTTTSLGVTKLLLARYSP